MCTFEQCWKHFPKFVNPVWVVFSIGNYTFKNINHIRIELTGHTQKVPKAPLIHFSFLAVKPGLSFQLFNYIAKTVRSFLLVWTVIVLHLRHDHIFTSIHTHTDKRDQQHKITQRNVALYCVWKLTFGEQVWCRTNPNIKEQPLGLIKIFKLQMFAVLCVDHVFSHFECINVPVAQW